MDLEFIISDAFLPYVILSHPLTGIGAHGEHSRQHFDSRLGCRPSVFSLIQCCFWWGWEFQDFSSSRWEYIRVRNSDTQFHITTMSPGVFPVQISNPEKTSRVSGSSPVVDAQVVSTDMGWKSGLTKTLN